jgi:hypothetical protein
MKHSLLTTTQGIHVPYAYVYANSTARLAATGFVSTDVGKLCRQSDTNKLYLLTSTTPTWSILAGTAISVPASQLTYLATTFY